MSYNLIVTEDAEDDLESANDWYEAKQQGLGSKFLLSVRNCITLIVKNPFAFAKVYLDIRKANTKKYPYSLFFSINEATKDVTIFAVFHHSRDNKKWEERIE